MPEDYFALLAFLFLTALTAVITVLAPIFYMARGYMIAAATDPFTPPPMPLEEMMGRQVLGLKLMFAYDSPLWLYVGVVLTVVQADAPFLDDALGGQVLDPGVLPPAGCGIAKVYARVLGCVCVGAAHVLRVYGVEFPDV